MVFFFAKVLQIPLLMMTVLLDLRIQLHLEVKESGIPKKSRSQVTSVSISVAWLHIKFGFYIRFFHIDWSTNLNPTHMPSSVWLRWHWSCWSCWLQWEAPFRWSEDSKGLLKRFAICWVWWKSLGICIYPLPIRIPSVAFGAKPFQTPCFPFASLWRIRNSQSGLCLTHWRKLQNKFCMTCKGREGIQR